MNDARRAREGMAELGEIADSALSGAVFPAVLGQNRTIGSETRVSGL